MIEIYWASSDKRVIRADYSDPIASWDEYMQAISDSCEMIASQQHTVHVIHNPGKASMPSGNAFFYLRRASGMFPPNTGEVIMVINNPLARRIAEVAARILLDGRVYSFADSVGQAYKMILDASRQTPAET